MGKETPERQIVPISTPPDCAGRADEMAIALLSREETLDRPARRYVYNPRSVGVWRSECLPSLVEGSRLPIWSMPRIFPATALLDGCRFFPFVGIGQSAGKVG